MKTIKILFFLFIIQICPAQNHDLVMEKAMVLFNDGKIQQALQVFEQIKDQQTTGSTNINIWKKHCEEIREYKFKEVAEINDSLKIVIIKTSLLAHFGVYNNNTKKYTLTPVYDEIPFTGKNSKHIITNLNHQTAVFDLDGKTIIPPGTYATNVNIYDKYIILFSEDQNSMINLYSTDGKLLLNNLKYIQQTVQDYFVTRNNSGKFGLFDIGEQKYLIDDCDKIESIYNYYKVTGNDFFIKRNNQTEVRNFKTKSTNALNAFDEIITFNKGLYVFDPNQTNPDIAAGLQKDKRLIVKENSKFGIYNLSQNKYDTEPVYDSINYFYNCLQNKVWKNLKYDYPVKEDFDYISNAVVYTKDNLFGLKTILNKTITAAEFDDIKQISSSLFLTKKQKMRGWISVEKDKIWVVKPQFDHVYLRYDATDNSSADNNQTPAKPYLQTSLKGKIGKYTADGKERIYTVAKGEKGFSPKNYPPTDWSYANPDCDRVLTSRTKFANPDKEEFNDQTLFGLDDKKGNEIVKPVYTQILSGLDQQYLVVDDRYSGVIDKNGKTIIKPDYSSVGTFDNKYYLVSKYYNFGLCDKEGNEIFPIIYKEIRVFLDGFYLVKDQDNSYKIVDSQNKTIYAFPKDCDYVYKFEKITSQNNETFFYVEGYYKYLIKIENSVCTRILDKYDILNVLGNNVFQIRAQNLIGFYDLNSKKLIEPKFKGIEIIYSNAKRFIYAKTDKYFDTIIDENLNTTVTEDNITAIINNVIYYEKDGKYGFFDKSGKKTKTTFQNVDANYPIYSKGEKFFKFYENNTKRPGLVSDNGKIIIKANKYDVIYQSAKKVLIDEKNVKKESPAEILICIDKSDISADKIDFVSFSGKKIAAITNPKRSYSVDFRSGIAILTAPNEVVFFDLNQNKIIQKLNCNLFLDFDGGFTVMKNDNAVSAAKVLIQKYSTKGNLLAERVIDKNQDLRYLDNWNLYLIQKKENKYGIAAVDEKNKVPFVYDTIIASADSVYIAKKNTKYGIIDRHNNIVLNFDYDNIETQFLHENKIVRNDLTIREIKDKRAPYKSSFNFIVSKNNKSGILGPNLKIILPVEYDNIRKDRTLFSPVIARKGQISMVYSALGTFMFETECDSIMEDNWDNPKVFRIFKDGKQGFLDQKGKMIFPLRYVKAQKTYIKNLFIIEKDSQKYIADSETGILSDPYDEINTTKFYNYPEVKNNNKYGLTDHSGTLIIPAIYDAIGPVLNYKYMVVSVNGMQGIVDLESSGSKVLPLKIPVSYSDIKQVVNNKYLIVSDLFKTGVIDFNNKIVIPMIYDSVYYQQDRDYFVCNNNNGEIRFITADNIIIKDEK